MSKFKTSTDDKFGMAEIMAFVFERAENIVGKGENAGYQHFLFYLSFQKASNPGLLGLCGKGLTLYLTMMTLDTLEEKAF